MDIYQALHDTKLRADIAESAVLVELLKRGHSVLRPIGDRLPYDLAVDVRGKLVRLQVKSAWYEASKKLYTVDARRTQTNRRSMRRTRYTSADFDFAILYLPEQGVCYIMPVEVFMSYRSGVSLIERTTRQRTPRSAQYRERWDLLAAQGQP